MASKEIDIKENDLLKIDSALLAVLLKDMTTGHNILWCTDNYEKYGKEYSADREIKIELITGKNDGIIKPRTEKSKEEQLHRVKQKGEVFTPAWVCNIQNNCVDEVWCEHKNLFNIEKEEEKTWETTKEKVSHFGKGRTWQDYVLSNRLEITCGEAPYLTSRYDAVSGDYIDVPDRIGLLDRKLRIVSENTESKESWIEWAYKAMQSTYGYEWQGDNVIIARENMLFSIAEYYKYVFNDMLGKKDLLGLAEIITWNIWQMDGLKFVIPNSCRPVETTVEDLFERKTISKPCPGCRTKKGYKKHTGIYCKIMDWKENISLRFVDLMQEEN